MKEPDMEKITRGAHARQLLDDELIKDFFKKFEDATFRKWKNSKSLEEREDYHKTMIVADAFHKQMTAYIMSADVEMKKLEERNA